MLFVQIGPVGSVQKYWWEPAERLNLPKLASLRHGLLRLTGGDLEEFRDELTILWDHLARTMPGDETSSFQLYDRHFEVPLVIEILHTFEAVTSAVDLAQAIDGFIEIGS